LNQARLVKNARYLYQAFLKTEDTKRKSIPQLEKEKGQNRNGSALLKKYDKM